MDSTSAHKKFSFVRWLAQLLDSKFNGPFGFRFGLDAIIGLIPFYGDLFTSLFSYYIVFVAAQAGCSPAVIIRMALNVLFEDVIGLIPIVGNIFDFVWKANDKNIALFERYQQTPKATSRSSALIVGLVLAIVVAVQIAFFVVAYKVTVWIIQQIIAMS